MNLKHLTDEQLLKDTEVLVGKERAMTLEILYHLQEIDKRKLYCDLKYGSIYEYCIKTLKFSEGTAQRRISSARLLNEVPSIKNRIKNGELNLTHISSAAIFFREQKIKEPERKKEVLEMLVNLSKKECDQKLFELSGGVRPNTTVLTIHDETYVLLQKARSLLGLAITQDELLRMLILEKIEMLERQKFKKLKRTKPDSKSLDSPPPVEVSRVIPAEIRREVWERDGGKCVICGSTFNLQIDHIIALSLGGTTTLDNLRLLCFNCNQRNRITSKL